MLALSNEMKMPNYLDIVKSTGSVENLVENRANYADFVAIHVDNLHPIKDRPSAVDCLEDPWFNLVKPMLTQIDTSNSDNISQNGSHDVSTRPDSNRSFGE
ncbi:unnamed protein product [Trichobilharzia regenti]|nr:unnamed protein product [Trichobilharzia regenti]